MNIASDTVVRFHYTLREGGQERESSVGREPVAALIGHGNIIAGLEQALIGHAEGDHVLATVPPDQGYGERQDNLVQRVSKKYFRDAKGLRPGATGVVTTRHGPRPVTVLKVGMSVVDVDLNHPLAGRTLEFEVDIVEVRAASAEELAHGHAHGAGGHAHDEAPGHV